MDMQWAKKKNTCSLKEEVKTQGYEALLWTIAHLSVVGKKWIQEQVEMLKIKYEEVTIKHGDESGLIVWQESQWRSSWL